MDDPSSPPPAGPDEGQVEAAAAATVEEAAAGGASPGGPPARSAIARDAAEVLTALAHTVRSFILYEAANERIRGFLQDVRARVERFLEAHGEMALEIRPWDITIGEEVVYSDPDRERSLAFRLYRDGVRRLVIRPGLAWDELVCLIGILSIRYKGVRTLEDDVVTLLWRAGFSHIELTAVEGVVASEDDSGEAHSGGGEGAIPRTALQAMIFNAPYVFDYPWPSLTQRTIVEYRPVPPSLLGRIAEDDAETALAHECIQLTREVLAAVSDPDDPLAVEDATPVLREMSAFLAGEQLIDALMQLARTVATTAPAEASVRGELLGACTDADIVRRLIERRARDGQPAPPELIELLSLTPGDHLGMLVDLFAAAPHGQVPRAVAQLLESQARGRTGILVERLATLDGAKAVELLRVMARGDPDGAVEAAAVALSRPEEELQLEAVQALEGAAYGAKVGRALVSALASAFPEVRLRAIAALVRQRERRAFPPLLETLRRGAGGTLTVSEARAIGAALVGLDPERARPLLREWVRPAGLLGRIAPGQTLLRWAAVDGLALLPGQDSEDLLAWLAQHGSDELKTQAETALHQLRLARGGAGG